MRKFVSIIILVMFIFLLGACQSSTLSLQKVKEPPEKLADYLDPTAELQMVNDGNKGSYIVFTTSGKVEAEVKSNKNVIRVYFNKPEETEGVIEQQIFYLTKGKGHDTIAVYLNDEETYFNNVASMQ